MKETCFFIFVVLPQRVQREYKAQTLIALRALIVWVFLGIDRVGIWGDNSNQEHRNLRTQEHRNIGIKRLSGEQGTGAAGGGQ